MSVFSGQQDFTGPKTQGGNRRPNKGVMREMLAEKRAEAEARNAAANAKLMDCGHVHGEKSPGRCEGAVPLAKQPA